YFEVALMTCEHREWQKPGGWNDPDNILVGSVGSAQTMAPPAPVLLTPTEQYSFMSLWALMASPLVYGGDMTKLDEFTLNVLCNPEIIAVNLDPLGQCARVVTLNDDLVLMIKDLEDGSKAVGLCNRGEVPTSITAKWTDLGVAGPRSVRDLWRQKDLGTFTSEFKAEVPRHGVLVIRVQ
ncbi:MAG: Alpha-galactosidase, partial [Verrucomicrobia bacterium]|nr:Alpha-galactosidase [Verrucomicrobiota bacterium]